MSASDYIVESERKIPVAANVDVVVAGGGPGGWPAALAAARNGAEVLLVERYGFLGGMNTAANVNQWGLKFTAKGSQQKPVCGGIAHELVERMVREGGLLPPDDCLQHKMSWDLRYNTWEIFDPETLKIVLLDMMSEANVKLLLHTFIANAIVEGGSCKGLIVENKGGRQALLAKAVIDATGDADVAYRAGAEVETKTGETRLSTTLVSTLGGVNVEELKKSLSEATISELQLQAIENGDLPAVDNQLYKSHQPTSAPLRFPNPYGIGIGIIDIPDGYPHHYIRDSKSEVRLWGPHANIDPTDPWKLTEAEVQLRRGLKLFVRFMRKYVSGCENSYIEYSGSQVGVRESRRMKGEYVLTADDVKNGRVFPDVIALGRNEYFTKGYGEGSAFSEPHGIPYGCLVSKNLNGLLASGRCISVDERAAKMYSPRESQVCMVIGQAAGTAAALAVKTKVELRSLDIRLLQKTLVSQGANLGQTIVESQR